uniref:XK-related protein n=1 Tax=Trichuris muris TaxID=70415 RepID=A0A5S6QAS4_TRIMR
MVMTRSQKRSINGGNGVSSTRPAIAKRSLPPPDSLFSIWTWLAMHLLKSSVLFPIEKKVLIFSLWVLIASFASDFANLPRHYYFVRKDNVLNVVFVKWGWAWLLVVLGPFVCEELAVFRRWDNLRKLLEEASDANPPPQVIHLSSESVEYYLNVHRELSPRIRFLFVLNCLLNLLWEFMLVITTLYYHSFAQKFSGAAIAIGCWFITYRVWYPCPCSPGLPGSGGLKYQ